MKIGNVVVQVLCLFAATAVSSAGGFAKDQQAYRVVTLKNPAIGRDVDVVELNGKLYATYTDGGVGSASFKITLPLCRHEANESARHNALVFCKRMGGRDCRVLRTRTRVQIQADMISWGCDSTAWVYDTAHPVDSSDPKSFGRWDLPE